MFLIQLFFYWEADVWKSSLFVIKINICLKSVKQAALEKSKIPFSHHFMKRSIQLCSGGVRRGLLDDTRLDGSQRLPEGQRVVPHLHLQMAAAHQAVARLLRTKEEGACCYTPAQPVALLLPTRRR